MEKDNLIRKKQTRLIMVEVGIEVHQTLAAEAKRQGLLREAFYRSIYNAEAKKIQCNAGKGYGEG